MLPRDEQNNIAKAWRTAVHLLEQLVAYAWSLGRHMGRAFDIEYTLLRCVCSVHSCCYYPP